MVGAVPVLTAASSHMPSTSRKDVFLTTVAQGVTGAESLAINRNKRLKIFNNCAT